MRGHKDACFLSERTDWETPQDLFDALDKEFKFNLDVCANADNTKCDRFYARVPRPFWEQPQGPGNPRPKQIKAWLARIRVFRRLGIVCDSLAQDWQGNCWMNPPYGRAVQDWVHKAVNTVRRSGRVLVCLMKSTTDTQWWHRYVWDTRGHTVRPGVSVRFLRGRLKFGDSAASAPFPSVIVIFEGRKMRTPVK